MRYFIISTILFIIVLIIYVPWNLAAIFFPADDPLFKVSKDTWLIIMKSDITNDYEELANWIDDYHGEMYDQQVLSDVASWSLKNKTGFKKLMHFMEKDSSKKKFEILGFVIHQSGQYEDFKKEYENDTSGAIKSILEKSAEDKRNVEMYYKKMK